jgi:enoyl-CoA hydratase
LLAHEQLEPEALQTAQRIAALSPQAAKLNKQIFRQILEEKHGFAQLNRAPSATKSIVNDAYAYAPSSEHREGIAAFLEKRPPQF